MPATPETRVEPDDDIIAIEDVPDALVCAKAGKDHIKTATHIRARRLVNKVINVPAAYWGASYARAHKDMIYRRRIVAFVPGPRRKRSADLWYFYDGDNDSVNPLSLKGLTACFPRGAVPHERKAIPKPRAPPPPTPPMTPQPATKQVVETSGDEHSAPDLSDLSAEEYASNSDDISGFEDIVTDGVWESKDTSGGRKVWAFNGPEKGRISMKARAKLYKLGFARREEDCGKKPEEYDFVFGLQFTTKLFEQCTASTDLYQAQMACKRAQTPLPRADDDGADADDEASEACEPGGVETEDVTADKAHAAAERGSYYRAWKPLTQSPW